MRRNPRAGFTLIELLVVIAVIAILAAILFPVFAHVRGKARQATCLSNEKQIAMGWLMYIQDYDETLPFVLNHGANDRNNSGYGDGGKWPAVPGVTGQEPRFQLVTLVMPYVKNQAVWYCPSVGPNATCETCVKTGIWKKRRDDAGPEDELPLPLCVLSLSLCQRLGHPHGRQKLRHSAGARPLALA
jgi:prepilin-type N-terminal cleavage/methylation domain-containing protein